MIDDTVYSTNTGTPSKWLMDVLAVLVLVVIVVLVGIGASPLTRLTPRSLARFARSLA